MPYRKWNSDQLNTIIPAWATALETNQNLVLEIKNKLLSLPGAEMRYSCDSITAGTAGDGVDRVDDYLTFVWNNAGSAHSWFVIRFRNGDEVLISCEAADANGTRLVMMFSPGGLFAGGTTLARPTASDEASFVNTATPLLAANSHYVVSMPYSADGRQFAIIVMRAGLCCFLWFGGRFEKTPMATPMFQGCFAAASGAGSWTNWCNAVGNQLRARNGASNFTPFMACEAWQALSGGTPAQNLLSNTLTSRNAMWPIGIVSEATVIGRLAVIEDLCFVSSSPANGIRYVTSDGWRWALIDDFAIPWGDGTAPGVQTDDVTLVATEQDGEVLVSASCGGGFLSFTNTPDEDLDADEDVARWTPIQFQFNAPSGQTPTILVRQGAESWLWACAYSEQLGAVTASGNFTSPMFEDKTTVDVTGSTATFIYTVSLLPNGGWQRPDITIVVMVGTEVAYHTMVDGGPI